MRTLLLLVFVLGLALVVGLPAGSAGAKGNDVWVLTGGELGDYASSVTLDLVVDGAAGPNVAAPANVPATHYDFLGSSGNFAIAYQIVHGPWVRYYPDIGLLRLHGGTDPNDPNDTWSAPSPTKTAELQQAIREAIAAKAAGQLERNPVAVDFRARSLEKVEYHLSALESSLGLPEPYRYDPANPGAMRITGSASEAFVMGALVDTVSVQPAGTTLDSPAYVINYSGEIRPGSGIGGLLGYYAPPMDRHSGRFWPDAYFGDKNTDYYATSPDFDAIIAGMLRSDAGTSGTSEQISGSGRARSFEIAVGAGVGLIVVLGGLQMAKRLRLV